MKALGRACVALWIAAPAIAQGTSSGSGGVTFPGGDGDNGQYASTILEMGISPRAIGVGEAMGAMEGDPSSIWYNAAGISRVKTNSFIVTGSQRFGGTQLAGAAVTLPTPIGTFGIGARAFNAGTIEQTQNYNVTGRSRAYQLALEGGGAIELARHWEWGGTLFYSQETLGDQSAGSIGVNSGMLFPDILGRLTLGGGFRNWGTPVTFDQESFRPPLYGYGAASLDLLRHRNLIQTPMLFKGQALVLDAKLAAQVDMYKGIETVPHFGIEATINGVAIGRVGYTMGSDNRAGLSLGAGINVGQFRLEYAFRNRQNAGASFFSQDPIGDEHHVSIEYFWGGRETNQPVVPVIINQPVDTAALNAAVRDAISQQMAGLRPLLDSLRNAQVEVQNESDLISKYIVPVHFGFDSSVVRDTDLVVLGQVADVIKRIYPHALVTIEGFADPAGSAEYNLRLSRRRADAVRDVMVNRFGLPEAQFKTVGYGEQGARQVNPGARKDESGAGSNRRVTFTIDATRSF